VPLWASGLVVALLLLARASHVSRTQSPQRIAYQGALGGLMLAAMAIPLGPLDLHVTAIGPVGVLLGGAGAFQVVFVVSVILALMGHGGVTVIGLNALILGAGAVTAALAYRPLATRLTPAWAMAGGAALGQVVTGALWLAVVGFGIQLAATPVGHPHGVHAARGLLAGTGRLQLFAAISFPWWIVGLLVETTIAFGLGRFLARVQPELLPGAAAAAGAPVAPAGRPA